MLSKRVCNAIDRAVKWANENPDKIIRGALARDENRDRVNANDPNATCFCILGRVARELNMETRSTEDVTAKLGGDKADPIWRVNDEGVSDGDALRGARLLEIFKKKECENVEANR